VKLKKGKVVMISLFKKHQDETAKVAACNRSLFYTICVQAQNPPMVSGVVKNIQGELLERVTVVARQVFNVC
jgi:hypothetical protein